MKRIIAVVVALSLLVFGVVASVFNTMWASDWENLFNEYANPEFPPSFVVEAGDASSRIAMLNIEGTIMDSGESGMFAPQGYNHRLTIEALKEIISDDSIKGILLNVDSPGGGVYESAEVHKYLMEAKEAGKTIYSSMGGMAASGGYYVSAPADQIFASEETLTGSIGVIMQSINYSQLAEDFGVEFETYTSGDMKEMLSGTKDPTEEETQYVQGMVDSMYQDFVTVVSEGRDMDEDEVRDLADGRIYLGGDAVDNGLVDQIGYVEDALSNMKENIGGNPEVIEYGYDGANRVSFSYKAKSFISGLFGNTEIAQIESLLRNRQGAAPMYLYEQ
ncbi:signal peptide peptidase SppA [Salinicoccus hispanicus]|uniref:Signal peptide peptidase SppA n=1 Tax=Salinicoccus hispanicus TaxID=157225 RepID=A0A6N8TXT1_9STAP|nr:signal peptide peptidase SppA [Salinicoccus hispanicus]MXQ50463.1 signal peptide peptidase SppA [Salinicoccus hispanicus]